MKLLTLLSTTVVAVTAVDMARDVTPRVLDKDLKNLQAQGFNVGVVKELMWSGEVAPGDERMLVGTIEQVAAIINSTSPGAFDDDEDDVSSPELRKRDITGVDCGRGQPCGIRIIRTGIKYLKNKRSKNGNKADCYAPAQRKGKPGCSRVSCSHGAGIFLCNKSDSEYFHLPCSEVAEHAEYLIDECWVPDGLGSKVYVNGLVNLDSNSYVLVTKTSC